VEFTFRREAGEPFDIPRNQGSSAGTFPLFGGFFQRGYITRDLDEAMKRLADGYGVHRFHEIRDLSGPGREHFMSRHIALAYIGNTMIELIEPNLDVRTIYAEHLPEPGKVARLHHLGFLVDDDTAFQALEARLATLELPVAAAGDYGAVLKYLYADARPELGHYLEYIRLGDEGRELFAAIPRN
jgi:hypothetical protein